MSSVYFDMWEIADSSKAAEKTVSYLADYISDMNAVVRSCYALSGSDSYGYVDTAVEKINKKIKQAIQTSDVYHKLSNDLSRLERAADETDMAVAKNIAITVSNYVGVRSMGQAAGDFIYNCYINFLNGVSDLPIVGEAISNGIRKGVNWISNTSEAAYNYFKYGDGKYVWNIVKSVSSAIVGCVGVVLAGITVMTAAPAMFVVAVVGFCAASVYAIMKFGDMMTSVEQNRRALDLSKQYRESTEDQENWLDNENTQGSLTAARYYGSITGVKDWVDKTDFGGKKANQVWGVIGNTYSWVENAAGTVSAVCQLVVGLGNAQYLKNAKGEFITTKTGKGVKKNGSFFENIRTTYLEKSGVTFERKRGLGGYKKVNGDLVVKDMDYSKAFKVKFFEGYGSKFSKAGVELSGIQSGFFNGGKLIKEIDGFVSNLETIGDWYSGKTSSLGDGYDTYKSLIDLASFVPFLDNFYSDIMKGEGILSDIFSSDNNPFSSPSENAYEEYLKNLKGGGGGGRF